MIPRFVRLLVAAAASLALVRAQPPPPPATAAPAAAKPATPDDDMLKELKLPDSDIDSVLSLLEILTGRSVLRPASLPTATYNIKITKPIPKSEAVLAIETVLALNGVGVSPQGDRFLVITPLILTRTSAPEMITGSAFDQPPSGKPATKIFQLDFLRVAEFAQMVAGILNPQYGGGVQLPNANALLVTDSVSNLQRVEALLGMIDKPTLGALKPKFYPLKYTKASDVVSKMRTILTPLQQQLGQATTYSADDGGAQIIVMTDPRQYPLFDDPIARLDVKSNPFTKNDVIPLKHADAKEVASLLTTIINGQNTAAQRANANALRPGQGAASAIAPTPQPVPGQPVPIAPALVSAAVDAVLGGSNEFSSLLTIAPDARSNAIVVSGTPDDLRLINNLIEKLDVILAQVRLEVVIAEVTLDDNHSSGISQLGLNVSGDKLIGFSGSTGDGTISIGEGTITRPGGTATVTGPFDLAAALTIKTTPRKNNTSILSKPSITTTHNKDAKFFFGETRPVVSGVTSTPTAATTTTGFSTSSQVQQQEIGTTITVKPLIGADGSVQLDIKMDISDVTGEVLIDNNRQYIIGKRTVNSVATAKTGEIVWIGGMLKHKDTKSSSRLGPIPILGDLFGSRSRADNRVDLVVFIRPVVLLNTRVDNKEAMERVDKLPQQHEILKQIDPTHVVPPKSLIEKVLN
ncbi:MAG: type II secretory pathway, component PulD [Verrucomicrobia bacterium]|nr:type II secretory pathway, component PulD [Verrucomicrobiota bacterium]